MPSDTNLSRAIRHLNGVYTQKFNKGNHRIGHLFQGRYKAILVEKGTHLLELCRYVVLNPIRARMAKRPGRMEMEQLPGNGGNRKERALVNHGLGVEPVWGQSETSREAVSEICFGRDEEKKMPMG